MLKYDPEKVSYSQLLEQFWISIDPLDKSGQFADRGEQYTSAIYYHNDSQKEEALASRAADEKLFGEKVYTAVDPVSIFYSAEENHQDFCRKNPERYASYKRLSGRPSRLADLWKKKPLTPLQYRVTRENGTETPFKNEYWDNKNQGIYVDVVSGEPLFSSLDKFDSGTGWPSFIRPLKKENIIEKKDLSLGINRTELRSCNADSHLGHVFKDGPGKNTLRYCVNSASLKFISLERLEQEGYGEYLKLFRNKKRGKKT